MNLVKAEMVKEFRQYFRLMAKYASDKSGPITAGVGLGLIAQICLLITPFLTRFIIDTVIMQKQPRLFLYVVLISVVVLLVLFASNVSANYILYRTFARMGVNLKAKLFNVVQFASFEFFGKTPAGEITYRILGDADVVLNSWLYLLAIIPIQLLLLLAGVFMIMWSKFLALFVFGVSIIQSFLMVKFRRPLYSYALLVKQKEQEVSGYATERLSKIQLIRSLCLEAKEGSRFSEKLSDLVTFSIRRYVIDRLSKTSTLVVNNLWSVIILWYGGSQVIAGKMSVGTLMAFLLLASILYNPINVLVNFFLSFQDTRASVNRISEYLRVKP